MDYKYINQLLERYWECQTSLEEEMILRAFFSQDDIPASLLPYRDLFVYAQQASKEDTLSDDFDSRMMHAIGDQPFTTPVKRGISEKLRPLFRAVALVAVIITIGSAMQASFEQDAVSETSDGRGVDMSVSVAQRDSAMIDSLRRVSLVPKVIEETVTEEMKVNQLGN